MDFAKIFALIALCSLTCACSTAGSTGSLSFDHRAEKLSGGKTALTVIVTTGILDNRVNVDIEAQAYADRYANQTCPKGYEFYTDAPITSRRTERNERTFVFGCR
jgi:hypothetical protein